MKLGKLLYFLVFYCFKITCFLCCGPSLKIWYRNSINEDYFSFGESDLDISVLMTSDVNLYNKILCIKKISKFFIIIKEINVYFSPTINLALQVMNPYEAKRDFILSNLSPVKSNTTSSQKMSYLLRIFFSESSLLDNNLSKRSTKKWNYHFSKILNSPIVLRSPLKYKELLSLIIEQYFLSSSAKYFASIEDYFIKKESHQLDYIIFDNSNYQKELLVLLPQCFCYKIKEHSFAFSENEISLIHSQVEWEIWAMMSQPFLLENPVNFFLHLENLKFLIATINQSSSSTLTQVIDKVINNMKDILAKN